MSKIHVLPDENLGGVLREFVEVDRPVKKGDFIVVYGDGHVYEDITVGKPYLIQNAGVNYVIFYDDAEDERYLKIPREDAAIIEPTDIVHIYGKRYRLVNRKAKVGETVIVFGHSNENGNGVFIVYDVYIVNDGVSYVGKDMRSYVASSKEYRVLEPVEPAEIVTPEEGDDKSVLDLLANLAQRVAELERQQKENSELITMMLDDIVTLDERTQPLLALIKAVKDDG